MSSARWDERQSVLTKASTWFIENEEVAQGQQLLSQIEAAEQLRAAVNSKSPSNSS